VDSKISIFCGMTQYSTPGGYLQFLEKSFPFPMSSD